jgi:hypothetical protein
VLTVWWMLRLLLQLPTPHACWWSALVPPPAAMAGSALPQRGRQHGVRWVDLRLQCKLEPQDKRLKDVLQPGSSQLNSQRSMALVLLAWASPACCGWSS